MPIDLLACVPLSALYVFSAFLASRFLYAYAISQAFFCEDIKPSGRSL
jgi:hypothetical protein